MNEFTINCPCSIDPRQAITEYFSRNGIKGGWTIVSVVPLNWGTKADPIMAEGWNKVTVSTSATFMFNPHPGMRPIF